MSVKTLHSAGFVDISRIADTLQGTVYKALKTSNNNVVVIKVTNKYLHRNATAVTNNIKYHGIKENILSEASILKHLTQQKQFPQSIIKFYDFYECDTNYYLVMECGGSCLFDFVVKAHRLIRNNSITIHDWHTVVRCIFKQMTESLAFIHSKSVSHNDVSLENFVINDVSVHCYENNKIAFDISDIQIKLIDFGLATVFKSKKDMQSVDKYCGKKAYKSPQVIAEKPFNARMNDLWGLGVCLFMLIVGCAPWKKADKSDKLFQLIMDGYLTDVLTDWDKMDYVTPDLINLLQLFFQYSEDQRIGLNAISKHAWLN